MTMRYLSLCSGIEAATVAWHHMGWTPVGFSEIEPFPAAVLAHHYPNVPNYGDMTQHENWPIKRGDIDLLVAGTPCQAFSVAGLRQGLRDPRGGLMLVYLQIAQRLRPRWLLWENVPGVLSANGGRDFAALLGGLSELGYGWAYRVLDCQYVRTRRFPRAIPQRRRRVFLVAHCLERSAGDWLRPSKALFDPESLSGHLAPQRQARQGVAPDAPRRAGAVREWDERQVSATVCSKWKHGGGPAGNEYHNLTVARWWDGSDVAPTILRKTHEQNMPDIGQFGALLQPTKAIAFMPGNLARGAGPSPNAEVAPTQRCSAGRGADDQRTCVAQAMTVRRLTPTECERLQGFPDGYTAIPWRKKPADQCPDGPRYKALGNSMATNCMEWIGERIRLIDSGGA